MYFVVEVRKIKIVWNVQKLVWVDVIAHANALRTWV